VVGCSAGGGPNQALQLTPGAAKPAAAELCRSAAKGAWAGEVCPGCGRRFPGYSSPVHPYIGSSAGCWAVYGQLLEREYGEFGYPDVHRLTVDAYAAQHPGMPYRQSIQSVAIHLISLHLVLERGASAATVTQAIRAAVRRGGFKWLA